MGTLKDFGEDMLDRAFPVRKGVRKVVEGTADVLKNVPEKSKMLAKKEADIDLHNFGKAWDRTIQRAITPDSAIFKNKPENAVKASGTFDETGMDFKKTEKDMKRGGKVSSASKRADGIAQRGKTKGRML